jgi:hypothetical protein
MRKRVLFFCSSIILFFSLGNLSCKKNNQDYLNTLLADGQWQLASVLAYNYTGAIQNFVDTLNTSCTNNQTFTFNTDGTCTYTNYDCIPQTATGHWSLSKDKLYLMSDIKLQDTVASDNSLPFHNAQIRNLGQYSLVLRTGYLNTYYPPNQQRVIYEFGFVRVKKQ